MKFRWFHLGLAVVLFSRVTAAQAGEIIDRIVAVVNGQIILQSQWDQNVCYEAFSEHRLRGKVTQEQRKAALDRLIDQELIRQQTRAADLHPATAIEVDRRIADIRKQYPEGTDDAEWNALLAKYGLKIGDLRERVATELEEMRTVDARLRPGVQVDSRSVESYYREKLLPELRAQGAKEVPLAEVAPEIREILAQQRINDLLIGWLHTLRTSSNIRAPFATYSEGEEH